ncbi:TPA: hypothetical protein ACG9XK_003002 [Enterococcus faecium]
MRRKAVIDRLYLFFWFFPIVLLPFTWVNAVVQGAEILGLIQGSGLVVSRNFPALTVFYWFYNILCWWKIESDFLLTLFSSFQLKKRLTFGKI